MTNKASLDEKFAAIHEHWRPKVVAQLNGQEVKLVKCSGVFPWHHHEDADEMFERSLTCRDGFGRANGVGHVAFEVDPLLLRLRRDREVGIA